jgi:hypothetical protein
LLALAASVLWGSSDFGGGLMSRRLHPSSAVPYLHRPLRCSGLVRAPLFSVPGGWYRDRGRLAARGRVSLASFYRAMADAPLLVAPRSRRLAPQFRCSTGWFGAST